MASEVRNLAQRSATAAKEIKNVINDNMEPVAQWVNLVGNAVHTMGEVVGAIKSVTDIMAGTSTASAEQSTGVAQVSEAVNSMDENT